MSDKGLIRGKITDADIDMMRRRIGYTNPTLRPGLIVPPWNPQVDANAVRRWAVSIGDDNPFYTDRANAERTRWKGVLAPPGFEWSMGWHRSPETPAALDKETHKALRGVQLYHSGAEYFYYRPLNEGVELYKAEWLADVEEKESRFATRSVIATNANCFWDADENVAITSSRWFVHAERRSVDDKKGSPREKDEPATYTPEQIRQIEDAYDAQFLRGAHTLYLEDVKVGDKTPAMVKGPLTITDIINMHMGAGWVTYPNLPFRLAYENRKKVRGFYSLNEFGSWDSIQRVHWDRDLAQTVGVQNTYDIGPMRFVMLCHYLTNFSGDDAWIHRIRYELRNFNYVGDTTWIDGVVTRAEVDPVLGPLVELEVRGVNQRGQQNISGEATILVASRKHGLPKAPASPPITKYRSSKPSAPGV